MDMLVIQNIAKTFNPGTVNEKKALDGLSVTLADGDFVTIVGSNGAGKSTLFNAIAGGFYVDEGSITLAGEDITFQPEYRRSRVLGRLFQDPMRGTAPHMTIERIWPWPISALPSTSTPSSAAPARRTGPCSGTSWPDWRWAWRTGWGSRWGCCPAGSGSGR
mgnify:CR=1 FL=1